MPWCKKMARLRSRLGVAYDDLLGVAMEAVWLAHENANPDTNAMGLATAIYCNKATDLWQRESRYRGREESWPTCETSDGTCKMLEMPDPGQFEAWEIVSASEQVERWVDSRSLAKPCVRCGTTAGLTPKECKRPTRSNGMCHGCYNADRYKKIGSR